MTVEEEIQAQLERAFMAGAESYAIWHLGKDSARLSRELKQWKQHPMARNNLVLLQREGVLRVVRSFARTAVAGLRGVRKGATG